MPVTSFNPAPARPLAPGELKPLPQAAGPGADRRAGASAEEIEQAAADFEALLIGAMLKQMRQSGEGGWLGEGEDQAGETMTELAEEHLARALAAQGGLGLSKMIVQDLKGRE